MLFPNLATAVEMPLKDNNDVILVYSFTFKPTNVFATVQLSGVCLIS